jgi:hypothetical protein
LDHWNEEYEMLCEDRIYVLLQMIYEILFLNDHIHCDDAKLLWLYAVYLTYVVYLSNKFSQKENNNIL